MAPPGWLKAFGDQLKPLGEQLKPLGEKLKAETSNFVELLKTPPMATPENASHNGHHHVVPPKPAAAVATAAAVAAEDGSGLLSGFLQLLAVTLFLGLLGVVASVIVMEDQSMQSAVSRVASRVQSRLLLLIAKCKAAAAAVTGGNAAPAPAPTNAKPAAAVAAPSAEPPLAKTKLAESYVEVENDAAEFEMIGAAKWHERSFVAQ